MEAIRAEFERRLEPEIRKFVAVFSRRAIGEMTEAVLARSQDPKLVELRQVLQRKEMPLPPDARFEQLKRDMAMSQQQLGNKRLIGAQDLGWALINNPSFLFNR